MESKETEKFNKILINGYEELLKYKPENPQAHFIHYLMSSLPEDVRQSDPELYKFYQKYDKVVQELYPKQQEPQTLKELLKDAAFVKKVKDAALEQFREFDKDGSQYLDVSEFEELCKSNHALQGLPEPTPELVQQVLDYFDKNKDGKVSLKEYQGMIIRMLELFADLGL